MEKYCGMFFQRIKIGGAPLNVALRMNAFGANVAMVSRVGADEEGAAIVSFAAENGVNTDFFNWILIIKREWFK